MITHYTSCQQCHTVSNSVNSVNSYSAVLPPSPMVFFFMISYFDQMTDNKWNTVDIIYVCCEIVEVFLSCKVASLEY